MILTQELDKPENDGSVDMSLYKNIHAKRARIKAGSGEKMARGKNRPSAKNFKQAAKTAKKKKG